MSGFKCLYCNMIMAEDHNTRSHIYPAFCGPNGWFSDGRYHESTIEMCFHKCPNCGEYTVTAKGTGAKVKDVSVLIRPQSIAKKYPDYIPSRIREDYEEACAIIFLSPKASATLARRCLQGMIRDFWGISKRNLYDEISELEGKVQPDLWAALDGLRQLGNIGAHMERDTNIIVEIDSGEAEKLIKLDNSKK